RFNNEIIMSRIESSIGSRQYEMTPYHNGKNSEVRGSAGLGATQNQVDAFFMANGRSIDDPASGYVATGTTSYKAPGSPIATDTYNHCILYRVGNLFLDYAEALNESTPGDPDVITYINLIRERAGVPTYGSASLPVPAGQAAMRIAIQKERRSELAFENVRYFDTRRWKIAETTDNGPIYGLNITQNLPGFFTKTAFESRIFTKRHYLFPIPSKDVNADDLMVQNPGW
ncbi:MAG: RagB/SusD family nutrient uptake outer membrane protein, partial [Sphingobacteriaceae bacterium]